MVVQSPSCSLFSHPNTLLRDHLVAVGNQCYEYAEGVRYDLITIGIENGKLGEILQVIGYCHDFGKGTSFFQEYLFCSDPKQKNHLKSLNESKHGLISAVFTYYVIQEIIRRWDGDFCPFIPLLGFEIVRRHHGNLQNVADEVRIPKETHSIELISGQLSAMDRRLVYQVYEGLISEDLINGFFQSYTTVIHEISKSYRQCEVILSGDDGILAAVLFQFCYSILISADKEEASGLLPKRAGNLLQDDLVDRYRIQKGFFSNENEIAEIRNTIYEEVVHAAYNSSLDQRITSLNVPTGTGKTLTGLSYALKIRSRIYEESGFLPRIIYSLPYISIIDQNSKVFEEVFVQDFSFPIHQDILLKHHNLADMTYTTRENEYGAEEGLFMVESWQSEVIVTTFFQLFHTLISNRNRTLRKFFRIANAVVLLDEIQTIPHKYWLLLRRLFQVLSNNFFTHFVFMTATQPFIFDPSSEITELVPDKRKFFTALDRISLYPELETITLSDFGERLIHELRVEEGKDFLIVMNTIGSCRDLYQILTNDPLPGIDYYYLSAHIIPKERLNRINSIREKSGRKVIVSTQLVEAGVDIDVDIVYRDFASLDSINQSAGRCNRHFKRGKGVVRVIQLVDDKSRRELFSYIYSGDLMRIGFTKQVLSERPVINEPDFLDVIDSYYQLVKDAMSDNESKKILKYFSCLQFEGFKEFQPIQEKYPRIDVFVCVDEEAELLWIKYQEILSMVDRMERRRAFIEIKRDFHQYVIAVPRLNQDTVGFSDDSKIGYISKEEILQGIHYDIKTGFTSGVMGSQGGGTLVL